MKSNLRTVAIATAAVWMLSFGILIELARHHISTYAVSPLGDSLIYICSLAMMGSLFLFAAAGIWKPIFESKPLSWMASISYSFYLFNAVTLALYPGQPMKVFVITVLASTLVRFTVEKPLLSR